MMRSESTESTMPLRLQTSDGAGIARRDLLHAGSDQRRCRAQQRHRLALHVGSHQRAVRVVVFEERNQRGSHRYKLLGRNVDVVDFVAVLQDEVAGLAHVHQFVSELAVLVHLHVGLGDEVLVLFPRGQVERVRDVFGTLLLLVLQLLVFVFDGLPLDVLADFELRIAGRR